MKTYWRIPCFAIFAILLFPACFEYQPVGPEPEAPVPPAPVTPIPQPVIVEEELIYSPAPCNPLGPPVCNAAGVGPCCPPPECNYVHFMRYRPLWDEPKEVDAVLVLMPGRSGGNNAFDYLGRQLVSMAENSGRGSLEVWAIERRTNCLEDLTGMNAAEDAGNPGIALDYYYFGAVVDGGTFQGFLTDEDVPFLSEFGAKLVMEDLYTVITSKIPSQQDRANTVFIGGHSMGAAGATMFGGWDFDGNPATEEDAGFNNCNGLIAFDFPLVWPLPGKKIDDEAVYLKELLDIRNGTAPRMDQGNMPPELFAFAEIQAMYASFFPDDEATQFTQIPFSPDVKEIFRLGYSRDVLHYISYWDAGVPSIFDFRFTNEALLGVMLDDNFQIIRTMQHSLGFLHGGRVVKKSFPGDFAVLFGLGNDVDKLGLFIAWDAGPPDDLGDGPLYSWVNFDEVGNASDPDYKDLTGTITYTTMEEEVVDIQDLAHNLYQGLSNRYDWYLASRVFLDAKAAAQEYSHSYGLQVFHEEMIDSLPKIEFMATMPGQYTIPNPYYIIPGYSHCDVVCAAVDRPTHRENEVFEPLLSWVLDHSGGTVVPLD